MMSSDTHRHRSTYYHHSLTDVVETSRYTADDGSRLIVESAHATLTSIGAYPLRGVEGFDLYRAVAADGTEGFVLKVRGKGRDLHLTSSSTGDGPAATELRYRPADEAGVPATRFYTSVEDVLIDVGDPDARAQENERLQDMLTRAHAAAAGVDGDDSNAWSRAAYEAACAAVELDPCLEGHIGRLDGPGRFSFPEYHRERVVWADLERYRLRGIEAGLRLSASEALARADEAAGVGPYTRSEFEAACAAADLAAVPDEHIPATVFDHGVDPSLDSREVLDAWKSAGYLGPISANSGLLSKRRARGMAAELAERRVRERAVLVEEGREFATPEQVETIMRLLRQRVGSGVDGAFFDGPTDRAGVANMDTADADTYITSLQGEI